MPQLDNGTWFYLVDVNRPYIPIFTVFSEFDPRSYSMYFDFVLLYYQIVVTSICRTFATFKLYMVLHVNMKTYWFKPEHHYYIMTPFILIRSHIHMYNGTLCCYFTVQIGIEVVVVLIMFFVTLFENSMVSIIILLKRLFQNQHIIGVDSLISNRS